MELAVSELAVSEPLIAMQMHERLFVASDSFVLAIPFTGRDISIQRTF